jgi:hypothetical protein
VRLSRENWIGVGALALVVGTMAIDHLVGTDPDGDDSFPVDPAAFFISVGISTVVAGVVFGWVIPRAKAPGFEPERAAVQAAVCSGLAVVPGLAFLWLGFPFVLAGGGIALGLLGRESRRRRLAGAAIAVGALVVGFGAGAYLVSLVLKA